MRKGHDQLVKKPWGYFQVLFKGDGYQVKQIVVHPGGLLSEQRHEHRAETWMVVQGYGLFYKERGGRLMGFPALEGLTVSILKRQWHSMENIGPNDLIIVEAQFGDYLEEDDIERRADKYGRTS